MICRYGAGFLRRYGPHVTPVQRKVLAALAACRTARMGGHIQRCDRCGTETPMYNSCADRHCPKCQGRNRALWLEKRRGELLPVHYFHVVFTVPHQLACVAAANPKLFYGLLFRAVRETLLEVAATGKHLGAVIGGLMVLHTWGQTLQLHPHVHVIVPGGGLSPDGQRWVPCQAGFFLPVRVLGRVFRGKMLDFLKRESERGRLRWTGGLSHLADRRRFNRFLSTLYHAEWNVYVRPPDDDTRGRPETALKYLARYT